MGITVKEGDKVMWSGCFGMDKPTVAVIEDIDKTEYKGEKYGERVSSVRWINGDWEHPFVCTLGNEHWAYSYQIKPII